MQGSEPLKRRDIFPKTDGGRLLELTSLSKACLWIQFLPELLNQTEECEMYPAPSRRGCCLTFLVENNLNQAVDWTTPRYGKD
jgi:hypothetical protein